MIHAMQIDNSLTFFNPKSPHETIVKITFTENTLTIYINSKEKNSFTFNISEINLFLQFLNNKCSSDIYQDSYNNKSMTSYLEVIKRVLINISLCNTLDSTMEAINDSCIETALIILQKREYSSEYI